MDYDEPSPIGSPQASPPRVEREYEPTSPTPVPAEIPQWRNLYTDKYGDNPYLRYKQDPYPHSLTGGDWYNSEPQPDRFNRYDAFRDIYTDESPNYGREDDHRRGMDEKFDHDMDKAKETYWRRRGHDNYLRGERDLIGAPKFARNMIRMYKNEGHLNAQRDLLNQEAVWRGRGMREIEQKRRDDAEIAENVEFERNVRRRLNEG